jgi:PPOX class probable F420-dependent enzyme
MLDSAIKELAQGKNFAALTTFLPNGDAMTQIMWVDADDDHLLINTETGRQKFHNVTRDPRVTVAVIDAANPYHYAEVRGRVVETIAGDRGRAHIDELAHKYTGGPYALEIASERVVLVIDPERQRVQG